MTAARITEQIDAEQRQEWEERITAAKAEADEATAKARAANDEVARAEHQEDSYRDEAIKRAQAIPAARQAHATARSHVVFAEILPIDNPTPDNFEQAGIAGDRLAEARKNHEQALNDAGRAREAYHAAQTRSAKARIKARRARHEAAEAQSQHEQMVAERNRSEREAEQDAAAEDLEAAGRECPNNE